MHTGGGEGRREMGKPKPEEKVRTTIVLAKELHRTALHRAVDDDTDLSTVITRALERYLKTGS
jgi:hypothetical protein